MEKINPRRRILLIAIASWAVVAIRAKSANPFTGALGLARMVQAVIRAPLRIFGFALRTSLRLLNPWRRKK